jgi:CheY-like chemotaxis protein
VGIAEASQHRLFAKFSQADASTTRKFGGTGLGLAISKRLMDLMGGQLDFRSVAGRGSTFFLTLPMAAAGSMAAAAGGTRAHHAEGGARKSRESSPEAFPPGLTVLLAEDNLINQKVGEKILTSLGFQVNLASNGAEAVSMAKRKSYDFILMDIHMPVMDGLTATREIRSWESAAGRKRQKIIALTASVMQNDRDISSHAGMDDFLSKPILVDELSRLLAAHARK